jgi:hypothetical protein
VRTAVAEGTGEMVGEGVYVALGVGILVGVDGIAEGLLPAHPARKISMKSRLKISRQVARLLFGFERIDSVIGIMINNRQ